MANSWTQEDVDRHNAKLGAKMPAHVPAPQKSKYRNVRTTIEGEKFDSQREANYWAELKLRERAREISDLRRQVVYELECPVEFTKKTCVVARYIADFVYLDPQNNFHVVDAKGKRTQMYALKKKWLELQYGIVIEEV